MTTAKGLLFFQMARTFKITLTQGALKAEYAISYRTNEAPFDVKSSGHFQNMLRKDGSVISFASVHMDKLADTAKEWAEEIHAEAEFEELTGTSNTSA